MNARLLVVASLVPLALAALADFFSAWDQRELQSLVDGWLNALRHCRRGS